MFQAKIAIFLASVSQGSALKASRESRLTLLGTDITNSTGIFSFFDKNVMCAFLTHI